MPPPTTGRDFAYKMQAADVFTWVKEKSQIEFVGSKPGGSHRGVCKRFTVDATADWADLSKGSFRVEIDATSLWSDDGGLRVKSEFRIDRTQWGMTHGKGKVNDEVEIAVRLAFGR